MYHLSHFTNLERHGTEKQHNRQKSQKKNEVFLVLFA